MMTILTTSQQCSRPEAGPRIPGAGRTVGPAWFLCRSFEQIPIEDDNTLLRWTSEGRVHPADYLVDLRFDRCTQAGDLEALRAAFGGTVARRAARVAWRFAVASVALLWIAPPAGTVALLTSVVMTLISMAREPQC